MDSCDKRASVSPVSSLSDSGDDDYRASPWEILDSETGKWRKFETHNDPQCNLGPLALADTQDRLGTTVVHKGRFSSIKTGKTVEGTTRSPKLRSVCRSNSSERSSDSPGKERGSSCWKGDLSKPPIVKGLIEGSQCKLECKDIDKEVPHRSAELLLQCDLCSTRRKGVAFDCGHQACAVCADLVTVCPSCREIVVLKLNLIY
jgi:hypothetical protein